MAKLFSKLLNFGIALLIILIALYAYNTVPLLKPELTMFYYQHINKEAGVVKYEKEYYDAFHKAEEVRAQSNALLDKTTADINELNGMSPSQFYNEFSKKQEVLMSDREQYIERMLEIDLITIDLEQEGDYHTFYEKRYASDLVERDAFKEYKLASATLAKGNLFYAFNEKYAGFMDYAVKEGMLKIKKDNIYDLKTQLIKMESFYISEIEPEIKNETFSADMNKWFIEGMNDMRLMEQFHEERINGQDAQASKTLKEAVDSMTERGNLDGATIFLAWSSEKIQPHYAEQKKLHDKSAAQYTEAYAYAKAHKLNAILNVWNNVIPGFEKEI